MTGGKGAEDFVLEIGVEPLPARFLSSSLNQLETKARERLQAERLEFSEARACGTFRRLVLEVRALAKASPPASRTVLGPPLRVARDPEGKWTPQAEGFARKQGVSPERLGVEKNPKGEEVLAVRIDIPGEPASVILSRVLPELIASLEFPKSMFWEESGLRFARPIRNLMALHGKKSIPFTLAGISTGRKPFPPPWASAKAEALSEAGRYGKVLEKWAVLALEPARLKALVRGLESSARGLGASVDAEASLNAEVLAMTEHPVCVAGRFDEKFLALPEELITTVLRTQLQFYPVRAGGGLAAGFIGVRDGLSEGQKEVRAGYERVVDARFNDAAFFIARDRRSPLESKLPALDRVTYHKDLGSLGEKARRVAALADRLAGLLGAEDKAAAPAADASPEGGRGDSPSGSAVAARIARLAYADLVTEVVKEFPELQASLGGWLARQDGESPAVCEGIAQFYAPAASGGPVPAGRAAAIASLAGKLETLAGQFAVGNKPTGSADPFALRRQATGAVRIVLEHGFELDLNQACLLALDALPPACFTAGAKDSVLRELLEFLWGRVETQWAEEGALVREIRSVRKGALVNLPHAGRRLGAVRSLRADPDFEPLAAAFKRASNILRQAGARSEDSPKREDLREAAEIGLFDAVQALEARTRESLGRGQYEQGLRDLVGIKPHLDRFFDGVMVMVEDSGLRETRLRLLGRLVRLFKAFADLSELAPAASASK